MVRMAAVIAATLLEIGSAAAQTGGATSAHQACMPDYKALCSGTSPGGGRVLACLEAHASQLSPGCKEALAVRERPPS